MTSIEMNEKQKKNQSFVVKQMVLLAGLFVINGIINGIVTELEPYVLLESEPESLHP